MAEDFFIPTHDLSLVVDGGKFRIVAPVMLVGEQAFTHREWADAAKKTAWRSEGGLWFYRGEKVPRPGDGAFSCTVRSRFDWGLGRARALGHELEPDPPSFSVMGRQTCKRCGRAVLGHSTTVYGSALEGKCTGG